MPDTNRSLVKVLILHIGQEVTAEKGTLKKVYCLSLDSVFFFVLVSTLNRLVKAIHGAPGIPDWDGGTGR